MKTKHAKTQKNAPSKTPYVWSIFESSEMKLCPAGTNMKYLFFNPEKYPHLKKVKGDRRATLTYPPKSRPVWEKHSIRSVGVAEHSKGYYHSRINKNFTDVLLVATGTLGVKVGGKSALVGKGGIVIVPPKCLVDTYVNRGRTVLYWLHLEDIPMWNIAVGSEVSVKTPECAAELVSILFAYECELYSKAPSPAVLEILAEAFVGVFGKILSAERIPNTEKKVAELARAMEAAPTKAWKLSAEAEKLGLPPKSLNAYFAKTLSRTFPKHLTFCKMKTALKMAMSGGFTNAQIAEKIGFCDAYSFSKAFKKLYGFSPKSIPPNI